MIKTDAKTVLAESLKDLLKEKSFVNIGVQDIVKNCDVSRTTLCRNLLRRIIIRLWETITFYYMTNKIEYGFVNSI